MPITATEFLDWKLPRKFKFRRHIASGAYGDVVEVCRESDRHPLAVKRLRDVFGGDPRRFTAALREIGILRQLKCSHIIELNEAYLPTLCTDSKVHAGAFARTTRCTTPTDTPDSISTRADSPPLQQRNALPLPFPVPKEFENIHLSSTGDVYLVFQYYPSDLGRLCRMPRNLTVDQVRLLFTRVLLALLHLKRCGIVHRDIKPSNILVDTDMTVRLTDFGQATVMHEGIQETPKYSITTRWYRAPEAIAGVNVTPAADIWAAGCVLAELLEAVIFPLQYRSPLFPGTSCVPWSPGAKRYREKDDWSDDDENDENSLPNDQTSLIAQRVGVPVLTLSAVSAASPTKLKCMQAVSSVFQLYSRGDGGGGSRWLDDRFRAAPRGAVDLLKRLLELVPHARITVEEALNHPWITDGQNNDEIEAGQNTAGQHIDFDLQSVFRIERSKSIDAISDVYYYNLISEEIRLINSQ